MHEKDIQIIIGIGRTVVFLFSGFFVLWIICKFGNRSRMSKIKISVDEYKRIMANENRKGNVIIPDANKNRNGVPNNANYRTCSKKGWRTIGGRKIYFRSAWEANYARYLEMERINGNIYDWEFEKTTFWFNESSLCKTKLRRGVLSYLPDFKIIKKESTYYWVEIKGYMDNRSIIKLKRMEKYYPNEKLIVVDKKWFDDNKNLRYLIKDWE
jgi:hypothetical protein